MMKRFVIALCLAFTTPALSHHAISFEFDTSKEVRITGVVTRVVWRNPHVLLDVDVKDPASGTVAGIECELGPVERLRELGWNPATVTAKMTLRINGNAGRQDRNKCSAISVILPTGMQLDAGQQWRSTSAAPSKTQPSVYTGGLPQPPPPPPPPPAPKKP